jgi:hypothetical protein
MPIALPKVAQRDVSIEQLLGVDAEHLLCNPGSKPDAEDLRLWLDRGADRQSHGAGDDGRPIIHPDDIDTAVWEDSRD